MKQRNLCLIGILLTILMIAGCYSGLNTYFGTAATLACQFDGESLCQESTVWTCEYIENMGYNTYMTTDPCIADLSVTLTGDATVNNAGDTLTLTATVSSTATANYDLEPGDVTVTVTDDLGNTVDSGTLAYYGVTGNLAPSNYETLTFDVVVDQDTTYTAEVATAAEYEFYNPDNTDTHSVTVGTAPTCNVGDLICFGDYTYEVTACDANGDPTYGNANDCSVANNGLGYCDSGACLTSLTDELDLTVTGIEFVRYSGDTGLIFEVTIENNGNRELGDDLTSKLEIRLTGGEDYLGATLAGLPTIVETKEFTMHSGTLGAADSHDFRVTVFHPDVATLVQKVDNQGAIYTFDAIATVDSNDFYGEKSDYADSVTSFWPLDCFEYGDDGGDITSQGHGTSITQLDWTTYQNELATQVFANVKQDTCNGMKLQEYMCQANGIYDDYVHVSGEVTCTCTNGVCSGSSQVDLTLADPLVEDPVEFTQMIDENTAEFAVKIRNSGSMQVTTSPPMEMEAYFYDTETKTDITVGTCSGSFSNILAGATEEILCQADVTTYGHVEKVIEQGHAGIAVVIKYDIGFNARESDENNLYKVGVGLSDDDLLTFKTVEDWLTLYP